MQVTELTHTEELLSRVPLQQNLKLTRTLLRARKVPYVRHKT